MGDTYSGDYFSLGHLIWGLFPKGSFSLVVSRPLTWGAGVLILERVFIRGNGWEGIALLTTFFLTLSTHSGAGYSQVVHTLRVVYAWLGRGGEGDLLSFKGVFLSRAGTGESQVKSVLSITESLLWAC